jgi:hypothetical protein
MPTLAAIIEHMGCIGVNQKIAIEERRLAAKPQHADIATTAPILRLVSPESAGRGLLEQFIADKFSRQYEARIEQYLPLLLSLELAAQPGAIAGLRCASSSRLFLEHYMDVPVEQAISRCFREPVDRDQVVEIGNLVSLMPGAASMLFTALPRLLDEAGIRWVTCTATPQVRSILGRLGFSSKTICTADPAVLGEAVAAWGTYYDSRPRVIAGDVRTAANLARRNSDAVQLYRVLEGSLSGFAAKLRALKG